MFALKRQCEVCAVAALLFMVFSPARYMAVLALVCAFYCLAYLWQTSEPSLSDPKKQ